MATVIEIRQVNREIEPFFELWERRLFASMKADQPGKFDMEFVRKLLSPANSVAPPTRWPVPANHDDNLESAWAWYIEEYVLQQTPVNDIRAQHVRKAFYDWGEDIFKQLFATDLAKTVYAEVKLAASEDARIEIYSDDPYVLSWPWEAMVDDDGAFVGIIMAIERRIISPVVKKKFKPKWEKDGSISVLLVTAREQNDVDYRLIGKELINYVQVTLLSPATLENLESTLSDPDMYWDVLHFDCHGGFGFIDSGEAQGYLLLSDGSFGLTPVSYEQLFNALGIATPQHIVLNACQSAKTEEAIGPKPLHSVASILATHPLVEDVTAMAYQLSVDAVAHLLPKLYAGLLTGERTCLALQKARQAMERNPMRSVVGGKIRLNDWMVPVIYLHEYNPLEFRFIPAPFEFPAADQKLNAFIGRDNYFYLLDQCVLMPLLIIVVTGLTGIGKTSFMKEYLNWRLALGDTRKTLWLPMSEIANANDFFQSVLTYIQEDKGLLAAPHTEMERFLVEYFNENPFYIVLDGLEIMNGDFQGRQLVGNFIEKLSNAPTIVLGASRGNPDWLGGHGRYLPLVMGGLDEQESWRFVNNYLQALELKVRETAELKELIFYIAGHPAMLQLTLEMWLKGAKPAHLLQQFKGEMTLRTRFDSLPVPDYLKECLVCLKNKQVRMLLPFLGLFEELVDDRLLSQMIKVKYGDQADHLMSSAVSNLANHGLISSQENIRHLHPFFGGILRTDEFACFDNTHQRIFTDVLYKAIFSSDYLPHVTIAMLKNGIRIAIANNEPREALSFATKFSDFCIKTKRLEEAYQMKMELLTFLMHGNYYSDAAALVLNSLHANREIRDNKKVDLWLCQLDLLEEKAEGFLPADSKILILLERAKIAEYKGDLPTYEKFLKLAIEQCTNLENQEVVSAVRVEAAHMALKSGEFSAAVEESERLIGKAAANSENFRIKAQVALGNQQYGLALEMIKTAILLSKKEKNYIGTAMNISIMAEIEGDKGDLQAALKHFEEAILSFEQAGDRFNAGISYHQRAKLYHEYQYIEEAGDNYINSAVCFFESGDMHTFSIVKDNFKIYLKEFTPDSRLFVHIKWLSAGLPSVLNN